MRTDNGDPQWLLGDHLGSTSLVYDGTETVRQGYMPWGEMRFVDGAGELPTTFRYTGQREEEGIGLYFYGARWYDSALGRFTQPDNIIPDPSNSKDLDRYAYVRDNPVQYKDPSGHDPWDFIGQFSEGFVKEMALRNGGWLAPPASQEVLSVNAAESSASLVGRIAADVATIVLGVENVTTGVGMATGGTAVACGTTLCLGAAATVTGGVVVAAVGATQVTQGALGLGRNLAQLTGNGSSGNDSIDIDVWESKKPFEGMIENPDGSITEYKVRKSPGRDGGWSRIVITRDANGNVIEVKHEAWKGTSDPTIDPPDHFDYKPIGELWEDSDGYWVS
jgi:RHS repeat-associated protein